MISVVWGLGHTLTLFVVAGTIIMFNWTVPPRLGLSMEFCVALALMVVGLLNIHPHRRGSGRPPPQRARGALSWSEWFMDWRAARRLLSSC